MENGNTYYYSQTTNQRVTGIQSIDNKLYYFDANGVKRDATFGIDVSKYQASVDFEKVKEAGVLHQRAERRSAGGRLLFHTGRQ